MKILAIIGSPRPKGNTYRTIQALEREMVLLDTSISFEYLFLSQVNLGTCKGCFLCVEKGEHRCPLKDDRDSIEAKMKAADGVIFGSPVYAYNVTWIMKNFIDRFAFRCHRPDFNGKKTLLVSTTGAVGLAFVLFTMGLEIGTWGFSIVEKMGIICHPERDKNAALLKKDSHKISKSAQSFYRQLLKPGLPKPGLIKLLSFKMQKKAFMNAGQNSPDYVFWKSKGWFEKDCPFYYQTKVGLLKNLITSLFSRFSQ